MGRFARSGCQSGAVEALDAKAVVNCFLGLFPEPWFTGFRFPMIEDLINQSPFIDYAEWRSGQHLDWDGPLGPATAPAGVRIRSRTAEGQQAGALSHKAALPPLISGVPNPDDHFAAALAMKMTPTPLEQEAVMDEDLQFVASVMAARRGDLRQMRRGNQKGVCQFGSVLIQNGRPITIDDTCSPNACQALNMAYINVSRIVPTARLRRTPILFPFSSFIVCTARACNNPHRLRDNALDFHASPAWTVLRGGHRSTPVGMPLTSLKIPQCTSSTPKALQKARHREHGTKWQLPHDGETESSRH